MGAIHALAPLVLGRFAVLKVAQITLSDFLCIFVGGVSE